MEEPSGAFAGDSLLAEDPADVKTEGKTDAKPEKAGSQPLVGLCGHLHSLFRGFLPGLPMIFMFTGDICH